MQHCNYLLNKESVKDQTKGIPGFASQKAMHPGWGRTQCSLSKSICNPSKSNGVRFPRGCAKPCVASIRGQRQAETGSSLVPTSSKLQDQEQSLSQKYMVKSKRGGLPTCTHEHTHRYTYPHMPVNIYTTRTH